MVAEVRQFGKVVLVRVFDDEQTSRTQQSTGEDFGRDVSEAGEIVGRIGKYDVVGSGRSVDEAHRIAAYDGYIVLASELSGNIVDETCLRRGLFHGSGVCGAAA